MFFSVSHFQILIYRMVTSELLGNYFFNPGPTPKRLWFRKSGESNLNTLQELLIHISSLRTSGLNNFRSLQSLFSILQLRITTMLIRIYTYSWTVIVITILQLWELLNSLFQVVFHGKQVLSQRQHSASLPRNKEIKQNWAEWETGLRYCLKQDVSWLTELWGRISSGLFWVGMRGLGLYTWYHPGIRCCPWERIMNLVRWLSAAEVSQWLNKSVPQTRGGPGHTSQHPVPNPHTKTIWKELSPSP